MTDALSKTTLTPLEEAFLRALEAKTFEVLTGNQRPRQRSTAVRLRGRYIETVELDAAGNVIEPCRKCGPVLPCSEHFTIS